jgi:hypothetical protein
MFSNALYEIESFLRMKLAGMSPTCSQRLMRSRHVSIGLRQAMGDGAPRVASPVEGNAGKQLGGRFAGLIGRLPVEERAQYHEIKAKQGLKAPGRSWGRIWKINLLGER